MSTPKTARVRRLPSRPETPNGPASPGRCRGPTPDDFSITGGTLRFLSPPDYDDPADNGTNNTYVVTVEATDHGGEMARRENVTVTVTNVDEDGEVTLSSLQPLEEVALTATLTDPDGGTGDTPADYHHRLDQRRYMAVGLGLIQPRVLYRHQGRHGQRPTHRRRTTWAAGCGRPPATTTERASTRAHPGCRTTQSERRYMSTLPRCSRTLRAIQIPAGRVRGQKRAGGRGSERPRGRPGYGGRHR